MPGTEDAIVENFQTFVAFVRKRVGDPHLAEDIVQDSSDEGCLDCTCAEPKEKRAEQ